VLEHDPLITIGDGT